MAGVGEACQISVALCTCNGERYLNGLLESLTGQQLGVAELVAYDDASEDASFSKLQAYAERAPFVTRLQKNTSRLGVSGNFSQAIAACGSDCIALCDQDDIWLPEKLAKLSAALFGTEGAVAAFSDALVVDDHLRPLGYTMWQQVGFNTSRQEQMHDDQPWQVLFKDPVVTGATMMFRRELLPFILPIPDGWMHDAWIAQIAASQGQLVAIDEPLIMYRQHGGNVIGGLKRTFTEQLRRAAGLGRLGLVERELRRYTDLRDRLKGFPVTERRDAMLALVDAKLMHLGRRRDLPDNRLSRWPTILREWWCGGYRRFAKDWRNVAADMFMP